MSTVFGGLGFQIHSDTNENQAARKTKREDLTKGPQQKRAALGTITNQRRIQPFRNGKQQAVPHCETNQTAVATSLSSLPFKIHVDEDVTKNDHGQSTQPQQTDCKLHPALTQLVQNEPLAVISHDLDINSPAPDSPMCLDTTVETPKEDTSESRMQKLITAPEYSEDIYRYLREAELRHRPKPGYLRKQPDITASMRTILVDWLVEVAEEYKLHRETLFLSVNYIDRFLSHMSVLRGKLQLVGAATTFLAAKYEEIYPPEVGEFVYITDDTYSKKQVLRMEHLVLKVLSFDVAAPTVNVFAEKFLKQENSSEQLKSLTMYLAELTLLDAEVFLKYLPSMLAASAMALAAHSLGREAWTDSLSHSTGYSLADLEPCIKELAEALIKAPQHPQQAIQDKYKQTKYHQVALLSPPSTLPSVHTQMVI